MRRRKLSDLRPPLGVNQCNLYKRLDKVLPKVDENTPVKVVEQVLEVYQNIGKGKDLNVAQEKKVYRPFVEKFPRLDFFKEVYLTSHAQYRMDQRGVSVKELGEVLGRYEKLLRNNNQSQKAFRKVLNAAGRGGALEKALRDKDTGLRVIMVMGLQRDIPLVRMLRENNFDVFKEIRIVTMYYPGTYVSEFPSISECATNPHLHNQFEYLEEDNVVFERNKRKFDPKRLKNKSANTEFIYGKLSQAHQDIQEIVERPLDRALDLPLNPYPSYETSISELVAIKYMQADTQDWDFVHFADKDIVGVYVDYLLDLGIREDGQYLDLEVIEQQLVPIILKLKYFYNRPRPYQYAQKAMVDFKSIGFESAKTPSYPSGHTMQAVYMAEYLSDKYPQHARELRDLARKISKTRIQAGEHFPSDCLFGAHLARILYRGLPLTMKVSSTELTEKEQAQKIIENLDTSHLDQIGQVLLLSEVLNVDTTFKPTDNLLDFVSDMVYDRVNDKTPNKCLDLENLELDNCVGIVKNGSLTINGELHWHFWLTGGDKQRECARSLVKEFGAEIVYEDQMPNTDKHLYEIELDTKFVFRVNDDRVDVKLG